MRSVCLFRGILCRQFSSSRSILVHLACSHRGIGSGSSCCTVSNFRRKLKLGFSMPESQWYLCWQVDARIRNHWLKKLAAACAAGALAATLFILTARGGEKEKPAPPPPGVTVANVIQKDVPIRQEWVGTMAGNTDADIRPKVEGFLLTRLYTEGSYVEKGQPMFQLDKRQTQASVEQATGNLERARAA